MNIKKISRNLIKVLTMIQAILWLLLMLFLISERYSQTIINYGSTEPTSLEINLKSIDDSQQLDTINFLLAQKVGIVKVKSLAKDNYSFIQVLVGGDYSKFPKLKYMGTTLLDKNDFKNLLRTNNPDAIIGSYYGSAHSIRPLNSELFGPDISFKKLDAVINSELDGSYYILGLDSSAQVDFLKKLSDVTNQDISELQRKKQGSSLDNSMLQIILVISLLIIIFINFVLMIIYGLSTIKEYGSLSLQGWNKLEVVKLEFRAIVFVGVFSILLNIIIGSLVTKVNLDRIILFLGSGIINLILLCLMIIIATGLVYRVNTVDAVFGKLPKKQLYALAGITYLLLNVGLISLTYALDIPLTQVQHNKTVVQSWDKVLDYQTLKDISPGNNDASYAGQGFGLEKELLNWYKSIEGNKGVYLASGEYYYTKLLVQQNVVSRDNAEKGIAFLSFSPNYLTDHGFRITSKIVKESKKGIRTYLIPSTWSAEKAAQVKRYLIKVDIQNSDVETVFSKNKKFNFISYNYHNPVFTWLSEIEQPTLVQDPVILINTTQSMGFIEANNLNVNQLSGPLKFLSKKALEENVNLKNMKKYQLADNELKFMPVKRYVDGLQKKLVQTIQLFSGVIALIIIALCLTLMAITLVYSLSNSDIIFVKEALGFSKYQLYRIVFLIILITGNIQVFLALLWKLKLGVVLIIVSIVMQLILLCNFIWQQNFQESGK